MTITVEDGTGKADAESFCTVAFADQYFSARSVAAWAVGTDADKEARLRKATDYLEQLYRQSWAGYRVTSTQALSWPRAWVPLPDTPGGYASLPAYVPNNTVPDAVKKACAELALRAISGDLAPDVERVTTSETVGPITVQYSDSAPAVTTYRVIENLLRPYFGNGNPLSVSLARA